jgi:alpha-ribazole phosphatase/probable phosphoglycerate mutase
MSEILFIRHAATDMAGTFCGHSNPPLNMRGRSQLSELVRTLNSESIDEIYASDLLRTRETGEAIAEARAIKYHLRSTLREINFGQWEGLTWKEIERKHSAYVQRWVADYPNLPAPDGESIGDFERRVLAEVKSLTIRARERDIVVVTHGGVLRTVMCRLCGYSEEEALMQTRSYCSIFRYKISVSPFAVSSEAAS